MNKQVIFAKITILLIFVSFLSTLISCRNVEPSNYYKSKIDHLLIDKFKDSNKDILGIRSINSQPKSVESFLEKFFAKVWVYDYSAKNN